MSCVGVGGFDDTDDNQQGDSSTLSRGVWSAAETPLPIDAAANPIIEFQALSCPTARFCAGVGDYQSTSGDEGLIEEFTKGAWTSITAPVPGNANANPRSNVHSVVCSRVGHCVAIGVFTDGSGNEQGLIEKL
jgi:hypothetical protein